MKCWKGFVSPDIETVLSPLRAWNVSYFYVLHKTSTVPASQSGANHLPWCHVVCSSTSQASLLMLQNKLSGGLWKPTHLCSLRVSHAQ